MMCFAVSTQYYIGLVCRQTDK